MDQQESEALAQFCADQHYAFDARAWQRRSQYDRNASTVAAMYLSMTDWYGHEDELERVAARAFAQHVNGEAFQRTAQASTFDHTRFAAMVRSEIAARQAGAGKPALKVVSESRNSA